MSQWEASADLEAGIVLEKGGGGVSTNVIVKSQDVFTVIPKDMSVCLESSTVLSTSSQSQLPEDAAVVTTSAVQSSTHSTAAIQSSHEQVSAAKSIAKLIMSSHQPSVNATSGMLQKVVNPPLITVLNPSGPLTVVKTLCVTSGVSSAPQFTLVNSAPLNVTNASAAKPPTITLLNAPVTVVKAISSTQSVEKSDINTANSASVQSNNSPPVPTSDRGHNVFVKNTCPDSTVPDMPQSHKLLTANNFPQSQVCITPLTATPGAKTVNGQRSKLKILGNVMPGTSQRFVPRQQQKMFGTNGAPTTKYLNKPPPTSNMLKAPLKQVQDKSPSRMVYPTHKSQIRTIPPINNYLQKSAQGIKTLTPQNKGMPAKVQRSNTGLRTIPPQRPPKMPNKPNYIGKHAVQAQKMRQHHGKIKGGMKVSPNAPYSYHGAPMTEKQLTFNQALTAEIIETLSNKNPLTGSFPNSKHYEILPARYDNAYSYPDAKQTIEPAKQSDDKTKSGLDALSLICQAVLLDHNYNATLPPDSPRSTPTAPQNAQAQVNGGITSNSMYSPGGGKRRSLPSSNTISSTSSLSTISVAPSISSNPLVPMQQDDDAASDISDLSERKHDTEGEETDTAPEAEAVTNEEQFEHYGDYVTRCICGFLHDDGYMVECDQCKVWQHVQCVVKNKQVPDEYLCEVCDPSKPIERQKARVLQQQWLRDRQFADPKLKKDPKIKEVFKHKEVAVTDSDSSDGEHIMHNNNVVGKGRTLTNRRKSETHPKQSNTRQRRDSAKEVVQRRQKRRERKVVKRKTKLQPPNKSHSDDENQDTWASRLPQLHQWIERYEEAVTNHYSPELRARISSIRVNGAHSELTVQYDASVHKCRVHTQPLTEMKYLVSTVSLSPNTPVVELRGKYMLSTQHRNSGGSLPTRQHSQRPGPFLFFYRLHKDNTEVCVDTRTYGNSARFIRRSCRPNAELRHCIEKGVLHLYIVSIAAVDKNCELTIKHESHDLAAIGTTQIACACTPPEDCTVNKATAVKKNGETPEVHRKRRGRRTTSVSLPAEVETPAAVAPPTKANKEEPVVAAVPEAASPVIVANPVVSPVSPVKQEKAEPKVEPVEVKMEVDKVEKVEVELEPELNESKDAVVKKEEEVEEKKEVEIVEEKVPVKAEVVKAKKEEPEQVAEKSPPTTPTTTISTRRSSQYKSDKEEGATGGSKEATTTVAVAPESKSESKSKCKKLSREERKLEAILRAIEQMEKADQRKQEHQAKQAHRRESEPGPSPKEEEKPEPKLKRRRRKGRARTTSTNAQNSRRNRLNSTDSYMTSGDETLLSPSDNLPPLRPEMDRNEGGNDNKAVGLLLALSNGGSGDCHNKGCDKSPIREVLDSNSNSAHSSPETHLSSACLLVQAAVEPMEPGFKFPKTKKGLMNEWLNKVPDPVQSASSISPSSLTPHVSGPSSCLEFDGNSSSSLYSPTKNLAALAQAASFCDTSVQPRGSAKKRWLRQAISEDHCDSPASRPESPPLSEMVAPPKKRRLPRESLSNEASPPTTPTSVAPPQIIGNKMDVDPPPQQQQQQEGCVEIVYDVGDGEEHSPNSQTLLESEVVLKERAEKMKQEYGMQVVMAPAAAPPPIPTRNEMTPLGCLMDPRLAPREHHVFSNSDHLVGTVEKTLSILGFEERRPESITPAKRKLSITEYRQRKKLNNNDKSEEPEPEPTSTEENNSSESFKVTRPRSGSTSSSTSLTSTDDEDHIPTALEIASKAPAFNSEPTELERQREISNLRLKKAFGLPIDDETKKPALDVEAILNCELVEPKVKSLPLPSPTFPIPGSCEVSRDLPSPKLLLVAPSAASPVEDRVTAASPEPMDLQVTSVATVAEEAVESSPMDEEDYLEEDEDVEMEEVGDIVAVARSESPIVLPVPLVEETKSDSVEIKTGRGDDVKLNLFYTPDEEEHVEEAEVVSYVPPFNNPVYPSSNFAAYTSTIDDDARYEGRNPSPPPNLDGAAAEAKVVVEEEPQQQEEET